MKHSEVKIPTPDNFPYKLPDGNWTQQVVNSVLVEKGAFFVHPKGSPYLGLRLEDQCELAKMRRPIGRMPKWKTSQMRTATKQDYEKLLLACTEALVEAWHDPKQRLDYVSIYVKLPFNFRKYWDKTFPRAFILGYDDWNIISMFRVDRIISWLYNNRYSTYTASELRKSVWQILQEQSRLDFYYDVASSQSIVELYGEIVNDVKEGRASKGKGKRAKIVVDNSDKV